MDFQVCRICGGDKELKLILDQDPEMLEKLQKCASVHISEEDLLPKLICNQCDKNLDLSYRLRKQSEATQKRLSCELNRKLKQITERHDNDVFDICKVNKRDVSQFQLTEQSLSPRDVLEAHDEFGNGEENEFILVDDKNDICGSLQFANAQELNKEVKESVHIDEEEERHVRDELLNGHVENGQRLITEEILITDDGDGESLYDDNSNTTNINNFDRLTTNTALQEQNKEVKESIHIDEEEEERHVREELLNSHVENGQKLITEEILITDDGDGESLDDDNSNTTNINNFDRLATNTALQEQNVEHCSIDLVSSSVSISSDDDADENNEVEPGRTSSLTCVTCHEVFTTKKDYSNHIKQHGEQRYQCIQCCKFFPTGFRLRRHEEIHNDVAIHQCSYCEKSYRALYNLQRHVQSVHSGATSFYCHICNVCFSRVDVLKRHLLIHSDDKDYTCSLCLKSFKTKDYLHAHNKIHDANNKKNPQKYKKTEKTDFKKYQCGYCGKLFKSSFPYKNHLLIHTNEKPHKCESCNKKFRTIAALTTHQRIHDDYRPYQCEICLKSFRQTSHLKDHKLLHSDNINQHTCSICQASFTKKSNLKTHMCIHSKEKPFKCAACPAEFSFMYLLQRHANRVHGRTVNYDYSTIETKNTNGPDISIVSNNDTVESELYQYIDTVADDDFDHNDDDAVDLTNDIQELYSSPAELTIQDVEVHLDSIKPQSLFDENSTVENEPIVDFIQIDSSNSMQSPQPVETDLVESINENEIYVMEQKVEVFVSEETNFTSMYDVDGRH